MTDLVPEARPEEVRTLREFAALSGLFEPQEALGSVASTATDHDRLVSLAAHLASACDTRQGRSHSAWVMRGPERRWELGDLADRLGIAAAVAWRRDTGPTDGDTGDLLEALLGEGPFAPDAVRGAVTGGSRSELERIAVALDRAGGLAPAGEQLDAVRAELARLDAVSRNGALLAAGFVGRESETAAIEDWLGTPAGSPPVHALFVGGPPGIGKSTLLEEAVRTARSSPRGWIVVRLDFDRTGLDVQDQTGLTVELARQLAAELGGSAHALREARLAASGSPRDTTPAVKGETRERVPVELVRVAADQLRAAARPVLLVLDTLEVLRARGETHPGRLFDWIDQLVALGLAPLAVLAAGRGDALDSAADRIGRRIDLTGLDDATADRLLATLDVPESSYAAVRAVAQGNPLVLRLAAAVAREAGAAALTRARLRRDGVAAAFLYRVLLSRITDEALRRLAHPGLVVRLIDPDVIREVLAPHLGLGRIDDVRARGLFHELTDQHWLVEPDPVAPGFVRHRPDTRRVLVRLLYETRPAQAAGIDRAAAAWFAARPEPWAAVEAAYHRLQLLRRDPKPPYVDAAVLLLLDPETIAELPPAAQDVVSRARGERSSLARGDVPGDGGPPPPGAADELSVVVERGDWLEGGFVYERTLRGRPFAARSREGAAALAFLWRSGQWAEAQRLLDERDSSGGDDADLDTLPPWLAAPRLEMRAELAVEDFLLALAHDPELVGRAAGTAYRGLRSELSDGALGFALRRAGYPPPPSSARPPDAVGAAFATWLGEGEAGPALSAAAERLGTRLPRTAVGPGDPAGAARLLAVLTPYADPAATLGRVRRDPAIERHAGAVDAALARLGGLLPSVAPVAPIAPAAVDPVDGLAALGLLAEWAGAAAFALHDADLRALARSAERWRRTTAGQWSYGRPPPGWDRPLDLTLAVRVAALEAAADPVAASRDQLAAWSGGDDPVRLTAELRRRLAGALDAGRAVATEGPDAIARALLRRRMAAAFVPPVAVLLARRELG